MDSSAAVDASGQVRVVERFANGADLRDFRRASRFYRPHALPFEQDVPFAEETEAAEVLQAAAELKLDYEGDPLRLLRRACRAEEQLRKFVERRRGERIKGPLRLSREEILQAMAISGLWDSPTLRQAVDDRRMNADAERPFLSALGKVIARWPHAGLDRTGVTLVMLDEELRAQGLGDLGKMVEEGRRRVLIGEDPVSIGAESVRRSLRRARKFLGQSRPPGRPKGKPDK